MKPTWLALGCPAPDDHRPGLVCAGTPQRILATAAGLAWLALDHLWLQIHGQVAVLPAPSLPHIWHAMGRSWIDLGGSQWVELAEGVLLQHPRRPPGPGAPLGLRKARRRRFSPAARCWTWADQGWLYQLGEEGGVRVLGAITEAEHFIVGPGGFVAVLTGDHFERAAFPGELIEPLPTPLPASAQFEIDDRIALFPGPDGWFVCSLMHDESAPMRPGVIPIGLGLCWTPENGRVVDHQGEVLAEGFIGSCTVATADLLLGPAACAWDPADGAMLPDIHTPLDPVGCCLLGDELAAVDQQGQVSVGHELLAHLPLTEGEEPMAIHAQDDALRVHTTHDRIFEVSSSGRVRPVRWGRIPADQAKASSKVLLGLTHHVNQDELRWSFSPWSGTLVARRR